LIALRALVIILYLIWPAVARAHTDEYFDKNPGPHRGQMRMAGPYHLELVAGKDELTLYVTDHANTPIESAGGSAKAILTSGKKRDVIVLMPAGENVLKGSGEFKLTKSTNVSMLVKLPDGEPQRAHFTLKSTGKTSSKKSKKEKQTSP
jgi:hypothetical protein